MGLGLGIGGSLADVAGLARVAERRGFESVWVAELTRSATIQAAAAITETTSIGVGTAATLAFPRSPTVIAMEAWDLDELSGGRLFLGLGSQVKRVMEARFGVPFEHPAARLADYVAAVRVVWAANRGEPVTHNGPFYRISMPTFHGPAQPGRRDVPILFAAVGPVMSRTAGAVADGVLGHPLASPRYLGTVVTPAIATGAQQSGRPPEACPITAAPVVSIGADEDAARRAARLQLAFYATTRAYAPILDLHDRGSIQGDLRRAFVRRDHARMIELVDDALLDAIAVAGRLDEARDRLANWLATASAAGARIERAVLSAPWYGLTADAHRQMIETIGETFGAELQVGSPRFAEAARLYSPMPVARCAHDHRHRPRGPPIPGAPVTSNVGQNYPYTSETEAERAAVIERLLATREELAATLEAETTPLDTRDRWWVWKCPTKGCPGLLHAAGYARDKHALFVVCDATCGKTYLR